MFSFSRTPSQKNTASATAVRPAALSHSEADRASK